MVNSTQRMLFDPRILNEATGLAWKSPFGVEHRLDELTLGSSEYLHRKLSGWHRKEAAIEALFPGRMEELNHKREAVSHDLDKRTIVFLSYENYWAKSGGLTAVANMQVDAFLRANERAIRLSPLHQGLACRPDIEKRQPFTGCKVAFEGKEVEVLIYKMSSPGNPEREWFLFSAPGFFELDGGSSHTDPYVDSQEVGWKEQSGESRLLRDSLFACKAVPSILAALGITQDIVIHANEWQFISTALTVKEALLDDLSNGDRKPSMLKSACVTFTMHNPYDHYLPPNALKMITDRVNPNLASDPALPMIGSNIRNTAFSVMMPLLDAPVITVSRSFAEELLFHPLQTGHFMPHLQDILAYIGVVGINNGSFISPERFALSTEALLAAMQGDIRLARQEKLLARQKGLEILADLSRSPGVIGELYGDRNSVDLRTLDEKKPIFVASGRLDIAQKGLDIARDSWRTLYDGVGKLIVIGWPGTMTPAIENHIEAFEQLAHEKKGEVLFIPKRLDYGYDEILAAASFSLWPSIYEPFGSYAEALVNGTPVCGRITGGFVAQNFMAMQNGEGVAGYLESPNAESLRDDVISLQQAQFPSERRDLPLYELKVATLGEAILKRAYFYSTRLNEYYRSLASLNEVPESLPWATNISEYETVYRLATQGRLAA